MITIGPINNSEPSKHLKASATAGTTLGCITSNLAALSPKRSTSIKNATETVKQLQPLLQTRQSETSSTSVLYVCSASAVESTLPPVTTSEHDARVDEEHPNLLSDDRKYHLVSTAPGVPISLPTHLRREQYLQRNYKIKVKQHAEKTTEVIQQGQLNNTGDIYTPISKENRSVTPCQFDAENLKLQSLESKLNKFGKLSKIRLPDNGYLIRKSIASVKDQISQQKKLMSNMVVVQPLKQEPSNDINDPKVIDSGIICFFNICFN